MLGGAQRFAAIADIHGNSAALRAVLGDMDALEIMQAVNLGDHFSGPLDSYGTAEILKESDFPSIRGNHDRWLIEQDPAEMGPSDRVAHDQLSPAHKAWLRELPPTLRVGEDVLACHGTPKSDTAYWLEAVREDAAVGMADRAWIEAQATGLEASLILCAHTHTQRSLRLADGRQVVNPGSVGCPGYDDDMPRHHVMQSGTPAACYAILERVELGWDVTFRQVLYDSTAMVELAQQHGRAEWARAIATGWVES